MKLKRKISVILTMCSTVILLSACGKSAEQSGNGESLASETESKQLHIDPEFVGEVGYILENQLWDYRGRFDDVYQWADNVYLPFAKIDGAEMRFVQFEEAENQGYIELDGVSDEMLNSYLDDAKKQGYSVWEDDTSVNIYKDGIIMFMLKDGEKIRPYIYTGNVKSDRDVSLSDARKLIEDKKLLEDDEYFKEYCVIAIENASIIENGLYEFVIISARNDEQLYNMPYYLITDGENVRLFEQEIWTPYYPSTAVIYDGKLMLTYIEQQQGAGPQSFIGTYVLKEGIYVQENEILIISGVKKPEHIVVGKIENGEYKLYRLKENEKIQFPAVRKDMWILGEEYELN